MGVFLSITKDGNLSKNCCNRLFNEWWMRSFMRDDACAHARAGPGGSVKCPQKPQLNPLRGHRGPVTSQDKQDWCVSRELMEISLVTYSPHFPSLCVCVARTHTHTRTAPQMDYQEPLIHQRRRKKCSHNPSWSDLTDILQHLSKFGFFFWCLSPKLPAVGHRHTFAYNAIQNNGAGFRRCHVSPPSAQGWTFFVTRTRTRRWTCHLCMTPGACKATSFTSQGRGLAFWWYIFPKKKKRHQTAIGHTCTPGQTLWWQQSKKRSDRSVFMMLSITANQVVNGE